MATVPEVVEKLIKLGFAVKVESGAGDAANCADDTYRAAGAEVVRFPGPSRRVDLRALLDHLTARGCISVMAEGGGTVLGALFDAGLVDKVMAFVAPAIIGGSDAPTAVAGQGAGVAAAISVRRGESVDKVDIRSVQQELLRQGARIQ